MPFILTVGAILLIALVFGPQWWIKHVLAKHGADRPDLPGTGGEFARHLLDEAKLRDVEVELTGDGDHYDPETRTVRLMPDHHDARSVAAVAVAAHEVSHAIQHARGEPGFRRRVELVRQLVWVERLAMGVLLLAPVLFIFAKSPALLLLQAAAGLALLGIRVVVHLATLPVELDASFAKALPVLEGRGYLSGDDLPAARSVLRAAALTYVAAALATLLNVARWFRILRF
ncbi:MAG: zinc metallopeptidase [Xanthobacteraceae bacterium]|nr:zinc metallopeptidase [Xanthobacteraceae bacterium]